MHALPALAILKRRWSEARIAWMVNPEWAPLLRGNALIDDVVEFPRREFGGMFGWTRFFRWARGLRERLRPDLVLDFQGLLRSALIGRWSGGDVWGTSDSREGASWLHHRVVKVPPRSEPVHAVRRILLLLEALGCDTASPLEWPLSEGTPPAVPLPAGYVLLHPFSRGEGKSIELAEVEAFCRAVAPTPIVIVGRADARLAPADHVTNLLNATTLPELCWLARRAAFVVSVDSGPMHIAAALNPNLLAIHTWSDPRKVGPYAPGAWVWKDERVSRMSDFPGGEPLPRRELGAWLANKLAAPGA